MLEQLKEFIEWIGPRWHRRSALVILLLAASGILLRWFSAIDISAISAWEWGLWAAVLLGLVALWLASNRLPRAPRNRIGFAVCIATESTEEQQKMAADFVDTLRELLGAGALKYRFALQVLPQRCVESLGDSQDAIKFVRARRCHFMVYGRARRRRVAGKDRHVLNLEGAVLHAPVPAAVRKGLSTEFAELFPRRLSIPSEDDLRWFELTAEWVNLVARYIIAAAALVSADIEYAQQLLESVQQEIAAVRAEVPAMVKIRQRTPEKLAEVYCLRAVKCYEEWRSTRDPAVMAMMGTFLDKLQVVAPGRLEGRILRSIFLFVTERDVAGAKRQLEACRTDVEAGWRYNYAFLLAYEGNLRKACSEYKRAAKGYPGEARFVLDVEQFISWVLELEPDKVQLHFCLGLVNYLSKGDAARALEDFEKFLERTGPQQFVAQRKLAGAYVAELGSELKRAGVG